MNNLNKKNNKISRRGMLPILGSSFLIPFLGFGNVTHTKLSDSNNEAYKILLKKDGTTVKVKASTLKYSKAVKKNISKKSFFYWLRNKF